MKRIYSQSSGQTLIELILALGVIAVVLTGLSSVVTSSLRYGQASQYRSRGVKYAQEGLEITRRLRDTSTWDAFRAYAGTGTKDWCLDESGQWAVSDGNGCPLSADSLFWRIVTFTWNDPTMEVASTVSWADRTPVATVSFRTYFTQWK